MPELQEEWPGYKVVTATEGNCEQCAFDPLQDRRRRTACYHTQNALINKMFIS